MRCVRYSGIPTGVYVRPIALTLPSSRAFSRGWHPICYLQLERHRSNQDTMKLLLALFALALTRISFGAEAKLVFADDFEELSSQSPPPKWAMWGAQEFKVPAHYTRDTTQPHGGQACFRIHHPANTSGYVVSSPQNAIQPKPGLLYKVSFRARSERPGTALFQWMAYRAVNPFVDAPSPGSLSCKVGTEWQPFTCSVREGLDFFADQSRFLLLTFHATSEVKTEQTLWIDDVRVYEEQDPHPVALCNEATIPHPKLEHRLLPGDRLAFSLSTTNRLRPANSEVGGVSFHRVCGWTGQPYDRKGEYTLRPELETAVRELRLPMTRFYAVGDEPFGVESSIDRVAEVCRRVGVPQNRCVLEFEEQGASTKLPPETWVRGVTHSLKQGYAFHYWEIANEPYSSLWGHGEAFPTPDAFVSHFKAVSRAIRKADPQAQVGVDINSEQVRWGNYLLKELAGDYDFVAPHYYCGANVHKLPFEEIALTENYRMLDHALRINALLRAYNPDRQVYQFDTEWGMICNTPEGKDADYEDRNANIIGIMHRAVRLIYYAREDILRGASGWQMLSALGGQGFGILSQQAPEKRFMLYWLYYYFNRHVGEWALQTEGTAPYYQPREEARDFAGPLTPVLATLSRDGREIFLVISNGSWTRAVPCQVVLQDFRAERADGIMITNNKLDGKPLLDNKREAIFDFPVSTTGTEAKCTIPPHAVVFITLVRRN